MFKIIKKTKEEHRTLKKKDEFKGETKRTSQNKTQSLKLKTEQKRTED